MKKFGWAVLGCGAIAAKVAKEINKEGSGKIVACWNRTKFRAEKFAARFGGKVYDTPEAAITAEGVEGVYIATTHDMHAYFTKLCIERSVPVLCEKPFTVNVKEAEAVFALAKERGVYVSEAMWTWHNLPALTVREWVHSEKVGQIKSVAATFAVPLRKFSSNPRLTSPALIGGALLDIGIYPVRYMYELFGMPKNITAKGKLQNGVDISEKITMDYGTFKAELFVSMNSIKGENLSIVGEDGKITVPFYHMAKRAKVTGKYKDKIKGNWLLYATQFSHVAEEIKAGKKESDYCPVQSTLDTMKLLDECRRQMNVVYPNE